MVNQEALAADLRAVFKRHGIKAIITEKGKLGFYDGEFYMKGIGIKLDKPDWYVKEVMKGE